MQHAQPLTWATALATWRLSAWDLLVAALGAAYLAGLAKCRRAGKPWPAWRAWCFLAGLVTMVLAVNSAISVYSDFLFWIHMAQHLTLIMAVPVLLITGRPLSLWVAAGARMRFLESGPIAVLTNPAVAFVLYGAVLIGTHLTPFLEVRLEHPWLMHVEIAAYLVSGYLFFLPIIGGEPIRWQRFPHPLRVVFLLVGMLPDTVVGIVLMMSPHPIAPSYGLARPGWGPTLLTDQNLAGAIMWFFGDSTMAALALVAIRLWLRASGPEAGFGSWLESARRSALAQHGGTLPLRESDDVDSDDQALAAYNAMLARLNNRDSQRDNDNRS